MLRALQGHVRGLLSLICPDSTNVVDGTLGRAHKWRTQLGPVQHVDLCTQVLDLLDAIGPEVQWLHIPSHRGIRGNECADSPADEGRRKSPLLPGQVPVRPTAPDPDLDEQPLTFTEILDGESVEIDSPPTSDSPDPDKDDRGQGRHTLPA